MYFIYFCSCSLHWEALPFVNISNSTGRSQRKRTGHSCSPHTLTSSTHSPEASNGNSNLCGITDLFPTRIILCVLCMVIEDGIILLARPLSPLLCLLLFRVLFLEMLGLQMDTPTPSTCSSPTL